MIETARRLAPCLVLAAALTANVPARAQAVAAPHAAPSAAPANAGSPPATPEQERLARHIVTVSLSNVREMRPLLDFGMDKAETEMKAGVTKGGAQAQIAYDRLGYWFRLFGDASWDELESDGPKFERILGPYMAKHFTTDELRAVSDLLDDPAFADVRANLLAKAMSRDPNATMSRPARNALRRFSQSDGGKSFMVKMRALPNDPDFEPAGLDLLAAWAPGAARRWGERAEAAEAARAAAKAAASGSN